MIELNNIIKHSNSIYHIDEKFKGLVRKNLNAKTTAETAAKTIFALAMCGYDSINELNNVNNCKSTRLNMLYNTGEYVPKMHGLRDAVMDTDYHQIEEINMSVIQKAKLNKVFKKNKVDGLVVIAWDGSELTETNKDIKNLPEREYEELGETRGYIKFTYGMNIGSRANIMVISEQHLMKEVIKTKSGKNKNKTIGETKMFEKLWGKAEKLIGGVVDVHVFDALYLNQNVMNLINNAGRYFVIRLKDVTREIYKDADGLFKNREANTKYELVETIIVRKTVYSKKAKKKNKTKTITRVEKRNLTNETLGEKKLIDQRIKEKKNSTVEEKVYTRVITRKEVWSDEFEITGYEGKVRVVKSIEDNGENNKQEIWVVTNMLSHSEETILKIMHLRWNIENCGFRTLKQRYNMEHIYIGDVNAINYIIQMIFLAFNLLELYMKIRLEGRIKITWNILKRLFEQSLHSDILLRAQFNNTS